MNNDKIFVKYDKLNDRNKISKQDLFINNQD